MSTVEAPLYGRDTQSAEIPSLQDRQLAIARSVCSIIGTYKNNFATFHLNGETVHRTKVFGEENTDYFLDVKSGEEYSNGRKHRDLRIIFGRCVKNGIDPDDACEIYLHSDHHGEEEDHIEKGIVSKGMLEPAEEVLVRGMNNVIVLGIPLDSQGSNEEHAVQVAVANLNTILTCFKNEEGANSSSSPESSVQE